MLEARGLTKYYSAITGVRDVNFCVRPGDVLGLLGPNGSGKSTTVGMVTGLLDPSGGSVAWTVGTSTTISSRTRRGRVRAGGSTALHLDERRRVPHLLRPAARPARPDVARRIDAMLSIFDLQGDRDAPMTAYSKGMRQKILISAALIHDPSVIVFDEPCSGLDVGGTLVLRSLVRRLAADGWMILYSSHVLEMVEQVCTQVLILHEGRVAAQNSVSELRRTLDAASLEDAFRTLVVRADVDGVAQEILTAIRS